MGQFSDDRFLSFRDAVPKQCCGLGSPPVRWSILGVGVVGLVCAGAGALLGALRASGRDHIAVALLMIGKFAQEEKPRLCDLTRRSKSFFQEIS